jgi:K+-transporting ATPase ATPase C chain
VEGAYVQAKRVAITRNISEEKIRSLVTEHVEKPLLGLLGTERVNVLQLNIDLDNLK